MTDTSSPSRETEFEFSPADDKVIDDLAWKMRFVGTCLAVVGILACLPAVFGSGRGGAMPLIQGVIFVLVGVWTRQAGSEFQVIVDTRGEDVRHLMHALRSLRKAFTLQFWLVMAGVALLVIALFWTLTGQGVVQT